MKTKTKFKLFLKNRKNNKKRLLKIASIVTLFAFLNCLTGCFSYYFKAITEKDFSSNRITQLDDDGKYFILHSKDNALHFYDLQIKGDTITGKLDAMLYYHVKYLAPKSKRHSYKKRKEPEVIKEVHIYTSDTTFGYFDTNVSIPMTSIQKITIYDPAKGATTLSWVLPPVIIVSLFFAAIFALNVHKSKDATIKVIFGGI